MSGSDRTQPTYSQLAQYTGTFPAKRDQRELMRYAIAATHCSTTCRRKKQYLSDLDYSNRITGPCCLYRRPIGRF